MKLIDPAWVVVDLLRKGFTVAYIDDNKHRRSFMKQELKLSGFDPDDKKQFIIKTGSGCEPSIHYEVSVAVNPSQFKHQDWRYISPNNISLEII